MEHEEKLGKPTGDKGGVLLGLGLIEDRQGNQEQALLTIREAQRVFRIRANGKPASLIAKAGMSIAKILLKLAGKEKDEAKMGTSWGPVLASFSHTTRKDQTHAGCPSQTSEYALLLARQAANAQGGSSGS